MDLTKSKDEQSLYNFYEKFMRFPNLIDADVIKSFKEDLALLRTARKRKKTNFNK